MGVYLYFIDKAYYKWFGLYDDAKTYQLTISNKTIVVPCRALENK